MLVAVPHGEFPMGHGTADNPEHKVVLSDFWIYSTEVTNSQYSLCVAQGWCTPPAPVDNPDFGALSVAQRPVVGVTYDQARGYCHFMGGDLPTEAQWEKAARGATRVATLGAMPPRHVILPTSRAASSMRMLLWVGSAARVCSAP